MSTLRTHRTAVISGLLLLGLGLSGCAATATAESADTETSSSAGTEVEAPEPAPDLTGEWKQTNSQSEDSYQTATITGDAIEVYWIADGGNTKSLYWAGSYEAPAEPGAFRWDSVNDTSKTESALLASGDATKTFTYDNDVISYDVTALGTTVTVELARQ